MMIFVLTAKGGRKVDELVTEQEVDLTQEQINEEFIAAWNRRAE